MIFSSSTRVPDMALAHTLLTGSRVAGVAGTGGLVVAQVAGAQTGHPMSVESVAIAFAGLVGVALVTAVASTLLATKENTLKLVDLTEKVTDILRRDEARDKEYRALRVDFTRHTDRCRWMHPQTRRDDLRDGDDVPGFEGSSKDTD